MATKQVLKVFSTNRGEVSARYIQKVTEKVICVINNERSTTYFRLQDGTLRTADKNATVVVDSEAIKNFLTESNLKTWDGGWKPDYNSRGEQVSKKLGSLNDELQAKGTFDSWLTKAGYTLINLNMSKGFRSCLDAKPDEVQKEESSPEETIQEPATTQAEPAEEVSAEQPSEAKQEDQPEESPAPKKATTKKSTKKSKKETTDELEPANIIPDATEQYAGAGDEDFEF